MTEERVIFDHGRNERIGLPEAVFCQGKTPQVIHSLLIRFARGSGCPVLFTRLEETVFRSLPESVQKQVDYDPLSRTAFGDTLPPLQTKSGARASVAVVAAGTSDGFVTWETARTLRYLGIEHKVFEDIGVAGLWRLTSNLEAILEHQVVIAIAGLDAALVTVLGGMCDRPIFAVPTSIGYGIAEQGKSALHSMLVSCAPGIAVMNIDNGYGAACVAARVLRQL